jgi:hypothetical protein
MEANEFSGESTSEEAVDDRGTGQAAAVTILQNLRDRLFDSNSAQMARALGRTSDQVESWLAGDEVVDDDAVMKARAIAAAREVEIED